MSGDVDSLMTALSRLAELVTDPILQPFLPTVEEIIRELGLHETAPHNPRERIELCREIAEGLMEVRANFRTGYRYIDESGTSLETPKAVMTAVLRSPYVGIVAPGADLAKAQEAMKNTAKDELQ